MRLAENECKFRRIDERRPAEGVEQLLFRERHSPSVAKLKVVLSDCAPHDRERREAAVAEGDGCPLNGSAPTPTISP